MEEFLFLISILYVFSVYVLWEDVCIFMFVCVCVCFNTDVYLYVCVRIRVISVYM